MWKGDGICDDINNNELRDYDGGDCCGAHVKKQYCFECQCIGNLNNHLSYITKVHFTD